MANVSTRTVTMDLDSLSEWAKDKPLSILQLDPADRAVLRIADERDAIQKKTFTKWVNKHLKKANRRVEDLFEDLRDGHNLLSLLEVLSGEHLPREKGKMRFHMLQNAQMALDFLRFKKIKLVNIRAEDIVDGNPKLTLGLIWTIILHFQISDIVVGKDDNVSAREALLRWARHSTARYPGVRVNDFTSSWRDGLAFSALVHRNRPDLLDWRKARSDRPRERLEKAFHVVEKEYGVTRLLDPEDVDTNEPDEKSLITYISSLYDVFPEPPSIHPLFDVDSQRRVHEYRDLAQQFISWCREKTIYLQERSFPPTLIEMKRLLSDLHHFRSEEVSSRKREKTKLVQIYKELERYFESMGEVDVEPELRPDAIENAWYRVQTAMSEREMILQEEIDRLERLQRLADKVQREIKPVDMKISELEVRIKDEETRIDRLHPIDAKNIVESLESEIRHLDDVIRDMQQSCQVLSEGRYPHAGDLQKKVNRLHQRWSQLHASFHNNLVRKLSGLKYPVQEKTVTRQTRMIIESRQIDTNPFFRDLQDHTEWCQNKLKQLFAADYGSDLPSVKEELDRQQREHKIIDQFHSKIVQAERAKSNFTGEELNLYEQRLNNLQKVYAELLSVSTKRLSDLDSLQHFLTQASAELQWLNEKEQIEITRDWADVHLDLPSVHKYYEHAFGDGSENLMSELEKRELHFATILDSGEALLNQQHPASKCIETHLTVLQQQWAWLLQLTLCLEVHLKNATDSHRFYTEIKDAEKWLKKRDDILNSTFSQSDFGLDQGETLLRGMQDLREELNAFGETVATLQQRSHTIVPLSKRRQPVTAPCPVQAICAYKQQGQLQIEKNEACILLDNSGRVKWRIRSSTGKEGTIPGACLLLPPPDQEAIDAAERIKRLFDRSISLWQKKHLRLRQNMIFATIRVVKGWTFDQFMAMGPEQRTAIRRALNDDADKLISEGDPNDPQLRRLRREMEEVNRLFDEFEKRARAEEESKQASRIFTEECITIKSKLEEMARELDQIILAPLPRDLDSLEHALHIHEDFHHRLQNLEPELKHLQETFRTIALKTPVLKKSLDNLMELWKELNTQSNLHKDRLKLLGSSLAGLEDNEHVISDIENQLAKHYSLPSTPEGLQSVFKQLTHLQDVITQQQPQMDKMNDAADQLGRMGVPTKVLGDLKRLHSSVERLNMRWSTVCQQIGERMRACENAVGLMKNLQANEQLEETWVDGTVEKLNAMPTATSAIELEKLLGVAVEHKPKIESVNLTGGRLIREAKIYDSKCLRFIDWLVEMRPSFSPPEVYRSSSEAGAAEHYCEKLHTLNSKYERLLEMILQRRNTAIEVNGPPSVINVQFANSLQKPLEKYVTDSNAVSADITKQYDTVTTKVSTYSKSDKNYTSSRTERTEYKNVYENSHKTNNIVSEKLLLSKGIKHPITGVVLSVGEAINLNLIDIHNNEIIIHENERISFEEATRQQLIDPSLLQILKNYSTELKVENAKAIPKDISAAIHDGSVDAQMGLFHCESGRTISLAEAYELGYLIKHESVTIKSNALCLSDAIAHGLVDAAGWITDRNTGDKFRLDSAIANKLIDASIREIVDTKNDIKISVQEALDNNILNAKTGRYVNMLTKEKLSFIDAKNRQLIVKPYTLKDLVELNLLDKQGKITSPMRRHSISILEAMEAGVLDSSNLKCISRRRGELMTLLEAITEGIILAHETKYKDPVTSEIMTIPEAVERGYISSVSQRSIFDIDGFKDYRSKEFVNFNVALTRGLLRRRSLGFVLETAPNEQLPLVEALKQELVREEVYEMFNRGIGVYNADKKELSLLDLCYHNLIDTKTGYLLDPENGNPVPLDLAIERKIITPEGALLLSSLLNITLTTETVVRTINRYVTIQDSKSSDANVKPTVPTFTEAVKQGLIDEDRKLFKDPENGSIYSVQQALGYGLLLPDSNTSVPVPAKRSKQTTTVIKMKQISPEIEPIQITTKNYTEKIEHVMTSYETSRGVSSPEPVQIATGVIYDPLTSLVIFTDNGQTENVLDAVQKGRIDEKLVTISDLANNEKISLSEAISRKIYDPKTNRIFVDNKQSIDLVEAAKMGILGVVGAPLVAAQGVLHTIRFIKDPRTGEEIPVELAYERGIVSKDQMTKCYDSLASSPEKMVILQKLRKIILQPTDALHRGIIDEETCQTLDNEQNFINQQGEIVNIKESLRLGLIDGQHGKIVDPQHSRVLNIHEAVREKIIDPEETNHILVPLAKHVTVPLLLQQGLLDEETQKIIHPESGCLLNIHEAIVCEVLDPLSRLNKPVFCTLEEAIEKGVVDEENCTVHFDNKTLSLTEAIAENVFEKSIDESIVNIPLVGMTLPVIVERGLLNIDNKTVSHPHTKEKIPLKTAIERNFIMSIPYTPKSDAIALENALDLKLIDVNANCMTHAKTHVKIPLREALQTGVLVVQPLKEFVAKQKPYPKSNVMETQNILHTVTTKTIELVQGHILISNNEIQNLNTGEICTIEEAKDKGIVLENSVPIAKNDTENEGIVTYPAENVELQNAESNGYQSEKATLIEMDHSPVQLGKTNGTVVTTEIIETITTTDSAYTQYDKEALKQEESSPVLVVDNDVPMKNLDVKEEIIQSSTGVNSQETWGVIGEIQPILLQKTQDIKKTVESFVENEKAASRTPIKTEEHIENIQSADQTDELAVVPNSSLVADTTVTTKTTTTTTLTSTTITLQTDNRENEEPIEKDIQVEDTAILSAAIVNENDQNTKSKIIENPILQKIEELHLYDEEHHYFCDPNSGQKISFQTLFLEEGIFDPDTILVKNFNTGSYEELPTALERPLLDKHTGHMVDPKTGKKIPFTECVLRNWIVQSAPKVEKVAAIDNEIDPETGRVILEDGSTCSIIDAINNGYLNMKSISVRDPVSGEVIPLRMAIELGVVDMAAGTVIDIQTLKEIPMEDAFKLGFLVAGSRKPISLEAAIRKGLYDSETGKLYDEKSQNQVDVQKSIEIGLVDPKISLIVDTATRNELKLDCAIEDELVLPETGQIIDSQRNELVPFDVGVEKHLVKTDNVKWSLPEILNREYYISHTGKVLNPTTGEEILLLQAIETGLVELDSSLVRDDSKHALVPAREAVEHGLIDPVRGILTQPELNLDEAFAKGYFVSTKKPLSLVECINRGMYDPEKAQFAIDDIKLDLKSAIALKLINDEELVIRDPKTDNIITVKEAITKGYLDPLKGHVINPLTSTKLSLEEALDKVVLIPPKRKRSLPDAVFRGLYDPKTGMFSNTTTKEKLSTERAIRRGILDTDSTLVNVSNKLIPFEIAARAGVIDCVKGLVKDEHAKNINYVEAFDKGVLLEAKKPMRLMETIVKNIFDETDGTFIEPKTGNRLTFSEALDTNLLDENSVQMKDQKTGVYKNLNLHHAREIGLIDTKDTRLLYNEQKLTIKHAFEIGILQDIHAPISLQRALHQGVFEEETGKLLDTKTGRKITLLEAMRTYVINPQLACYFDEQEERMLSLAESSRAGIIDRRDGVFREPGSNTFISLNKAFESGLIVDIETAGFGLYELLAMGFYDVATCKVIHPVTGRKMNLNEACIEDIVSLSASLIKEPETGKYIRLAKAVLLKVINDTDGCYNLNGEKLDLQEARKRGLIVSNRRLLSLELVLRMKLFNAQTGNFIDPTNDSIMNLNDGIANGFIDPASTLYKNPITGQETPLMLAIENGQIDVLKGSVLDPETKSSQPYDKAFDRGLLISVKQPFTVRQTITKTQYNLVELHKDSPREMSLREMIEYNIIDPNTALVQHEQSYALVPYETAKQYGLVDLAKRAVVDPKALYFTFESAFIIWTQAPISFDEAAANGSLNLETGMFTSEAITDTEATPGEKSNTYTLKDATTMGYINPESALVKDLAKGKLVRLPEAFRKGLIDANKANVLDTKTSKLHSLKNAYEIGLLLTPKRSLDLLESIDLNLYNRTTGQFNDPFKMSPVNKQQELTLNDGITRGLIDASTTVVRSSSDGNIKTLAAAITDGIIDGNAGTYVIDKKLNKTIDFCQASAKGLLLPAEQWQAVVEKFNLCEENLSDLLKWVSTVENKISSIGGPREKVEDLRSQINALKQIKEDIESQQRPVAACLEQIRQIVLTGSDVLSTPEVTTLENSGRELRSRVDRVNDRTVRLLRRLEAGRDELMKLRQELENFSTWLQSARRELEDKERSLSDLTRMSISHDSIRDFVSDVISHQADLRFITMSAQKFFDESKDYLAILNDFRTSLPERLPHIVPLSSSESPVRQEVSIVSAQYKDLMNRVNALQDRLSGLGGRQREYQVALEKLTDWMNGIQPRVSHVLTEPIAGDPKTVQDQMNEAKSLQNEILSNGRLLDNAQQALDSLIRTLGGQLNPMDVQQLEVPVIKHKERYQKMLDSLGDYCKDLDKTLVQSQGVQDALDNLMNWANQAEDKLTLQMRPASLIKERLQEQIRDLKSLVSDIQSHQVSIDSIQSSAKHLMNTTSNARIAKKVESNLAEATNKYEKLHEKVTKRRDFFEEVYDRLCNYLNSIGSVEQDLQQINRAVEERESTGAPVEDLIRRKEVLAPRYEECIQEGKQLIGLRDVTDTNVLRDRIKALEAQWLNINSQFSEKTRLNKQKAEQKIVYEKLLDEVLGWLSNTETRVNNLQPVAIDLNILRQQRDELKPILKDYRDFGPVIDKVNDIGSQYDVLMHPESPTRKHSVYSPIKRVSPLRRISDDARSPSPTKGGILSPLSTGSSGFGSRRSSQDGFQLSEMTPVQQQLNEVNNRYGLIGVRLNDRQNELDNLHDEVRKQFESLKNLSQFLERIQRQIPKELGSNKENADRCVKQARTVLEEMYEKQSLLDTTKAQVKELLRRKANVPGAEELRVENDTIVEKWKTLSDICKSRIEFAEKLRDFLDAYNNLKYWLDSKERLFTVLGPISSDPRMVQSQVQQVQVLREEFRTQQPQLTHFQDIGHDLITHMKEVTDTVPIENKLKEVTNKWEQLLAQLDERANSLGGAVDSSKEFDAAVNRLRESLQNISDNLESLPLDGDQQENLRKIENLDRQLEGQRPLLADVEQSAAHLCNILGDPASRSDINSRVAALQKQYQALQKKLDNKKAETEAALRDGRNFAENCTKTAGWLNAELSNLSERLLVSAHKPTLQHQIDTHEPIYREVMAREHEIIMLINKGKDLSDRQNDRSAKRDLERIQQQWDKLRREAVDRHTRLQTCMEHCKKYSNVSETLLTWLRHTEDKFENLTPCVFSKAALEARLRELQTFRNEVWKHSAEFETVMSSGETFLNSCDTDKEPVKSELQEIRKRWERLNNSLMNQSQEIEKAARRLDGFNDELRNLVYAVGRCEDRLAAHDALGGASKDPKLLDRIKAIRDELTNLSRPLDSLKAMAKDISKDAHAAGGNADQILDEVDGVCDRINDLQTRLNDRCGDLQSAATAVSEFNKQMKAVSIDLNDLEHAVETLPAPAREIKVVQQQIADVSKVQNKMDAANDRLKNAERVANSLADAGFLTDSAQTRDQLLGLRKVFGRLETRVRDQEDNLQNALVDLTDFYNMHDRTLGDIRDASSDFRKMKPVATELEQIRRQQDEMRDFREKEAEPLAHNVDKVNMAGRDLVRSAASGVSTAAIERDLEKMNGQWNDMKERMNERDRRLDVALLQSGKFQEALAGLSKWLSDTEDMVANQKPPSSDYKVAKAQLQEQKFLKKMLLDRQNSMSSLSALGKEVANHCEPSDRNAIEKQLNDLLVRFDKLTTGAEQREVDLEEAMKIAKHFHDTITPLELWLTNTERAVKAMEMVPTDEEKIQQRIHEHDRLHDEILSKKVDFSEVADIAGQLMQLVSDDEAVKLGEKVRSITEAYTDLVDASEKVGDLLAKSRNDLRHLVLTYQELIAWMESMENDLKRFKAVPVYTDKLLEQMDILLELNENIANNAPSVEATVASGAELIKHISNDEAIQLKDKLDSLQRRYGELTNRGGDLIKNAQNALPLVQQFHEAHERLVAWMQKAENTLATSEPRQQDVLQLESEIMEMRPILDTVILIGPQLCQISPGDGAIAIESIVTQDNRRFDAIVEQVQRKAERLHMSNQRTKEVSNDIDELLEWFRDMDTTLREAELPALEPKIVRGQLQEHRALNDDISSQKGRVRDITAATKKVLRESPHSETISTLREKLEDLKDIVDSVVQQSSDRLGVLEQALQLSEHFTDSHGDLNIWLTDMEDQISRLSMPVLRPDLIVSQQDKNERLLQSIAEHKPLLDKLNKTGEALVGLVTEDDQAKIHDILDSDNSRYSALKIELRERQQALENALQESSQFSDKLDGMLRALAGTADQVNQSEPLSALPPKIKEQIDDNTAIKNDLDNRSDAFSAVQRAANDVIAKAHNKSDPAVRDIKNKLEKLNNLWNDVQKATKKRGSSLDDILNVAEPFWSQLNNVMSTLKDLEEALTSQEPPAAQPQEIQKQQVALQEIRHEIDQTKPGVDQVRRHGTKLINMCGEPDKPEVKKHIEDLDHAWDNITALYAKREENLIDAMEKAMEFHETLQNLLKFLNKAEQDFARLGPVGSDIDSVKRQIDQLRAFKDTVDPHMVEVEALNRHAFELTDRTSSEQADSIRKPLAEVNRKWDNLLQGMVERQKQLEHALLHLGQFQHALNELLVWINKSNNTLSQLRTIPGDPQLLEVEIAKLKVLVNDIQAHQNSVDTLNNAGRQLIESEKGSVEASATQDKLRKLNEEWKALIKKAADKQHELEQALREANQFIAEVQDILGWLGDVDAVIGASKPVGGLPETATEQLERFMEVYNELEENRPKVETIQAQGQEYIKRQNQIKVPSSNLVHTLRTLKQRWEAVLARASDKKIKLEIALKEATEFHDTLQAFVEWLTQAEKQLSNAPPVSRVLETIQAQIEDHKILQKDVSTHRESMLLLDKKGTHLKYFSQKQDVILIKNLLVSVQHRWERVVSKAAERTRALDHGYKETREFNDAWSNMIQYLQEMDGVLDQIIQEASSSKEPTKIKKCISKLKESHRQLASKQSVYEQTMRTGKNLIERAPKTDEPVLRKMLNELKEQWSRVWSKSIERQRKLEEALLLSGQFSDALDELLNWLKKAKNRTSENDPVHGDLETVQGLIEYHKHFEQDLQKRANQMQGVLKTGRDLERSGNNPDVGRQLNELQSMWDDVKRATAIRGERLQDALKDAEKLNGSIQALFDWLDHAEHKLRYAKNAPDDEKASRDMMDAHVEFLNDLQKREREKLQAFDFAELIITKAYPDAIPIIRNWLTIIQQRWDEISQWALDRESKLDQHLQSLKSLDDAIEELLLWLNGLEATLLNLERESLPDEIPLIEKLIEDHKEFMENTARRQTEVDRACKPKQIPAGMRGKLSRNAKTPLRGSSHDVREQSPESSLRRQSFKGSRDQGLNMRKASRATPNRDTPDRDRLPHYGPRFSPSVAAPELEFRSPRAKLLWDKWRHVWMLSWERQRRLHEHLMYLKDVERVRNFSWEDWRKRFLKYMNHKKSRLTDLFRKMDKDNNGLIPRGEFIDGILNTKFDTSRMEMGAVADLFDRNGEGLIDWQEFIAALRPDWQERKPPQDTDKIHDEVKRLVMLCTCRQKFRVFQVGEGKYRFGDSQKLRLVRILRSTVMVRVGGGWVALDEFLQKNDPCRAKGRTNIELREQFILADGVSQSMAAFTPRRSTPNSAQNGSDRMSPYMSTGQGPIMKVRERSVRSIPMSRNSRSVSASTPDSLSDNEGNHGPSLSGRYTPRKVGTTTTTRTGYTPSGSRAGSKPNSRPLSRQGSKPPSRHGSNLSLDSADGTHTPSRIPQRKASNVSIGSATSTPKPTRFVLNSSLTANGVKPRKTTSGSASPAPTSYGGMSRSSSIPTLTGFGFKPRRNIGGGITSTTPGSHRASDATFSSSQHSRASRGTTPVGKREPFRL